MHHHCFGIRRSDFLGRDCRPAVHLADRPDLAAPVVLVGLVVPVGLVGRVGLAALAGLGVLVGPAGAVGLADPAGVVAALVGAVVPAETADHGFGLVGLAGPAAPATPAVVAASIAIFVLFQRSGSARSGASYPRSCWTPPMQPGRSAFEHRPAPSR